MLGRPSFGQLLDACNQAEAAADRVVGGSPLPIAVVKRKRDHDVNALVVMRWETWLEWYGPSLGEEPEAPEMEDHGDGTVSLRAPEGWVMHASKETLKAIAQEMADGEDEDATALEG